MTQEAIYYELLFFRRAAGAARAHSCKGECSNQSCPILLRRAICQAMLLMELLTRSDSSPAGAHGASTVKVIPSNKFVHLSTGDRTAYKTVEAISPNQFLTAIVFN